MPFTGDRSTFSKFDTYFPITHDFKGKKLRSFKIVINQNIKKKVG